jgi:hypothetical protein
MRGACKMKKRFLLLAILFFAAIIMASPASAFLLNWGFDADGGGDSIVIIPEYLNLVGTATINNNIPALTFTETGTLLLTLMVPLIQRSHTLYTLLLTQLVL